MLSFDRNKAMHWSPNSYLASNTAAPFAQLRGCCGNCNGLSGLAGSYQFEGRVSPPISGMGGLGYTYPGYEGYNGPPISALGFLGQDESGFQDFVSQIPSGGGSGDYGAGDFVTLAAQFDPEPISRAALQIGSKVESFFSFGAGRREANEIVPYQNEIHYNVLAPIAEAVNAPYKAQLSQAQLNTMLQALLQTKASWLSFLHNTNWSDGRAATQAENTLAFLFSDQERKIRELLVNAPMFGGAPQAPGVKPVYIPGSNVPQYPTTYTGTVGGSSFLATLQQYAPFLLLGAALFAIPKIGKYQR